MTSRSDRPPFYAHEKLITTIGMLATLPGDVRERLLQASPAFWSLKEEDFPEQLRSDFRWITMQMTKRGPDFWPDGRIRKAAIENTMRRIQKSTGTTIAERLWHIYQHLDSIVHPR